MQITFSMDSDVFIIDASTGEISTNQSLDRENTTQYVVMVTATDDGDPPLETNVSVTIDIDDVNDNSPVFPAMPTSFSISENLPMGTHVATISASDADEEGTENSEISFNITGGSGAEYFSIDSSSGNLTVAASPDYEKNTSFELVIEAYDGGFPILRSNMTFTILIRNLDDNAPLFVKRQYSFSIDENNHINDLVGRVQARDLDPHNRTIGYDISDSDLFMVDRTSGNITARVVYNLEELGGDGVYSLEVYTFYQDRASVVTDTAMVTITINDVDEFDTVLSTIDDIEIFENGNVSDVVRVVEASDRDANSSLRYSLSITENILAINAVNN